MIANYTSSIEAIEAMNAIVCFLYFNLFGGGMEVFPPEFPCLLIGWIKSGFSNSCPHRVSMGKVNSWPLIFAWISTSEQTSKAF